MLQPPALKFIRIVGGALTPEGLQVEHDYGTQMLPWEQISVLFAVRFSRAQKEEPSPHLVFCLREGESLYYLDGALIDCSALAKGRFYSIARGVPSSAPLSELYAREEKNFRNLVEKLCEYLPHVYTDAPLEEFLGGGLSLLPVVNNLRSLADYAGALKQKSLQEPQEGGRALRRINDRALPESVPLQTRRKEWRRGDVIEGRLTVLQVFRGGMGIVYIVFDPSSSTFYAVKSFQEEFLWDERVITLFFREAETWIKLERHRNIVAAELVKNIEGKPYLFLEYVRGTDLGTLLRSGPLNIIQAIEFSLQFCTGMDFVYNKMGIIHRDIKPSNCLITEDGTLKITDFGLARIFDDAASAEMESRMTQPKDVRITLTGTFAGTLPYMAPERFLNLGHGDIESDVYSFGVMLYEMLTGILPITGTDFGEFLNKHLNYIPVLPSARDPSIPPEIDPIVMRCLEKEPEARYHNFEELRQDLASVYEKLTGFSYRFYEDMDKIGESEWINKGSSLAELGHHKEAIRCYERALKMNPGHVEALNLMGVSLMEMGRLQDAIWHLDRALKIKPDLAEAWQTRGNVLARARQLHQAVECYDQALQIEPNLPEVWAKKGAVYEELRQFDEALKCYEQTLAINPRHADALNSKGNILLKLKRTSQALECFRKALEVNPRFARAWGGCAIAQLRLGMSVEAATSCDKALQLLPESVDAWIAKGLACLQMKNFREALESIDSAMRLDPHNVEAMNLKGRALYLSGHKSEALSLYEEMIARWPEYSPAWAARAEILFEHRFLQEALESAQKALELVSQNPAMSELKESIAAFIARWEKMRQDSSAERPHTLKEPANLEEIFLRYGDLRDAEAEIEAGLAVNPDNPRWWLLKALIARAEGKIQEALAAIEMCLKFDPHLEDAAKERDFIFHLQRESQEVRKKGRRILGLITKGERSRSAESSLFERGLFLLHEEDFSGALRLFEQHLRFEPNSAAAWFCAGICVERLGQRDRALQYLDRAVQIFPDSPPLWRRRGHILRRLARREEALYSYERAIFLEPRDLKSRLSRVIILKELDFLEEAEICALETLEYLEEQIYSGKQEIAPWKEKAILEVFLSRFSEARESLSFASQRSSQAASAEFLLGWNFLVSGEQQSALEHFNRVIELEGRRPETLLAKGTVLREMGKLNEALACFGQCLLQFLPSDIPTLYAKGLLYYESDSPEETLRCYDEIFSRDRRFLPVWIAKGILLFRQHKPEEALWCLNSALEVSPLDATALCNKGILYNSLNQPSQALACFDKVIERCPLSFVAWYNKAISFYLQKRYQEADESLKKALRSRPNNPEVLVFRGLVAYHMGDPQRALAYFARALNVQPDFQMAWLNRAILLYLLGRSSEALESFDRAIRTNPNSPSAWYCKSLFCSEMERPEEAHRCLEEALRVNSRYLEAWLEMGYLLEAMGRHEESCQSLDRALKLDSRIPEAWHNKGVAHFRAGNNMEALRCFDQALRLDSHLAESWLSKAVILKKLARHTEAASCLAKATELRDELKDHSKDADVIGPLPTARLDFVTSIRYEMSQKRISDIILELALQRWES